MAERFDAVVIGGGPAGSVAAVLLARLGWRIALIERRSAGEGKTCGHCLSRRAMSLLASIGLDKAVRSCAVGETRTLAAYVAPSKHGLIDHPPLVLPAPALLTPRDRLDFILIEAARAHGVTVFTPASATIACAGGRVDSEVLVRTHGESGGDRCRLRAPLIIGADGLGSRVAAAFGLMGRQRVGRKFGFSVAARDQAADRAADRGEMDDGQSIRMFIAPFGYLGLVRAPAGMLHGAALVQPRARGDGQRHPRAFLDAMCRRFSQLAEIDFQPPAISQAETSQPIAESPRRAAGPMPYRPKRLASCGAALVGDAAGYVEPFTGEGMCWAIDSALALAAVCQRASPGRWGARLVGEYEAKHRERIAARQRTCRATAWALERPWMSSTMFRAGAMNSLLGRHVAARLERA